MELKQSELNNRDTLKQQKPYVHEKMIRLDEKVRRGESIAIIQFQYNYACNMTCKHCSIKSIQQQNNNGRRVMTPDDIKDLARQADELGLARFEFNGGEPFVNKDYDEVIEAINPQKFYINSVTNGWLLDDKRAKHLKEIGVDRIQIAIDSLYPEEHDNFRQKKGAHARALKAVDACKKAGLGIFITTVVTKQRLYSKEFLDFIKFFNDQNIGVFITFAKPVGSWQGNYDIMTDADDLKYFKKLETNYNVFSHLTSSYGLNLGCLAVKGLICITQYGDVLPCQYIFISLGNIFEQPLHEIIQNGLSIKHFGEHTDICPIAHDEEFIKKYIAGRVYNKNLPVPYTEVFSEEDRTKIPFNLSI